MATTSLLACATVSWHNPPKADQESASAAIRYASDRASDDQTGVAKVAGGAATSFTAKISNTIAVAVTSSPAAFINPSTTIKVVDPQLIGLNSEPPLLLVKK